MALLLSPSEFVLKFVYKEKGTFRPSHVAKFRTLITMLYTSRGLEHCLQEPGFDTQLRDGTAVHAASAEIEKRYALFKPCKRSMNRGIELRLTT